MADPVVIDFAGKPVPWARTRVFTGRKRAIFFNPAHMRTYQDGLRYAAQQAMNGRALLTGALVMRVTAAMPIPQSWSKKKKAQAAAGIVRPITKPDGDNFLKMAGDSLNTIVFNDDAQIVDHYCHKIYSDRPSLKIEVAPTAQAEAEAV